MNNENEIVQYFVVNKELKMSAGKMGAQISHVATKIARATINDQVVEEWLENDHPVIILSGKEKDLLKLIDNGFFYIRDNGRTELPPNSLTVVGLPPMNKSNAQQFVKRLQLYKD